METPSIYSLLGIPHLWNPPYLRDCSGRDFPGASAVVHEPFKCSGEAKGSQKKCWGWALYVYPNIYNYIYMYIYILWKNTYIHLYAHISLYIYIQWANGWHYFLYVPFCMHISMYVDMCLCLCICMSAALSAVTHPFGAG